MDAVTLTPALATRAAAYDVERPYLRDAWWTDFFDRMAGRIVAELGPASVLHAGCGTGLLVEALRARGVEAMGVDVSPEAIKDVSPTTRPYCWVGALGDALPRTYDLIVSTEGVQFLSQDQAAEVAAQYGAHTDDILFSAGWMDAARADGPELLPPDYWVEQFASQGFLRDLAFDASFVSPWAMRFQRRSLTAPEIVRAYERRYWTPWNHEAASASLPENTGSPDGYQRAIAQLQVQLADRERALTRARDGLSERDRELWVLRSQVRYLESRWAALDQSIGWPLLLRLQRLRARLSPPGSLRDEVVEALMYNLRARNRRALSTSSRRLGQDISARSKASWAKMRARATGAPTWSLIQVDEVADRAPLIPHEASVDIVVCVHNALTDVHACLESVVRNTTPPYRLILVDDGSDASTRDLLIRFATEHGAELIRNEKAVGYTRAANQGMQLSDANYVLLLNSDTIVTWGWLDRLVACAESDPAIGIVGPLSNTASWQSIPEIEQDGDWAANPLPEGWTADDMARLVAKYSARLFPLMPFLNGFCLMLRRDVIEAVGLFDEVNLGEAYGEENDLMLRARAAGWMGALADDAYVYHAQSRSYSSTRRKELATSADEVLARKHSPVTIQEGVSYCASDPVLEGIRARSRVVVERQALVDEGRRRFAGRRVLFILPVMLPGGGANVVVTEAIAMASMGIEVTFFNLNANRLSFSSNYPGLKIPVIYGTPEDLVDLARQYDAIVATVNFSVEWLKPVKMMGEPVILGYYVQDYEPHMYDEDSPEWRAAFKSYNLFPGLVRFTKTRWNRDEVLAYTGADCRVVGVSLDTDLFRPRPQPNREGHPLRVVAMVRSRSLYRSPELTVRLLRRAALQYGDNVEIVTFGGEPSEPELSRLPSDFRWQLAGVLSTHQVANLLNTADIFVDFSTHQAMGLTALEAMACGAAVVVPERGGAVDFARHGENALVVDTTSEAACENALRQLIEDRVLRERLQANALHDVCAFYPERAAYNIGETLFGHYDAERP